MSPYPHLLAPYDFGFARLRNRIVMGAMHTRIETLDRPVERMAAFYRARARGEVGLILTGGFSPNAEGRMEDDAPVLADASTLAAHRAVTAAVHEEGGAVALQILHAGRYGRHALCVAPSALRAPINTLVPRALDTAEVWRTVEDYARCAELAREAGYDGVEIMGSEGYLINEFTAACTNRREDEFGGAFENRIRLPVEVVRAVRARAGRDFLIVYRISAIDLVEGGATGAETAALARAIAEAGADVLNTGIGWHEAQIPTIASTVPRAAWSFAVANVKRAVAVPVVASNRINTPEVAEALIASGAADFVSMARPLLADPDFARKARLGMADSIDPCVACNQACLDRIFTARAATCLVNPRAGRELDFTAAPAAQGKRIAVIGAGPAGLAFAVEAQARGHRVTLYEADAAIGGQLHLARAVPSKGEFDGLVRYFGRRLADAQTEIRLGRQVTADEIAAGRYDAVVIATGVRPRRPEIPGIDHPKVVSYADVLTGRVSVGARVAIMGAGGVGFDVAEFLVSDAAESRHPDAFFAAWGIDRTLTAPGGLVRPAPAKSRREVFMLQRKPDRPGARLGKTTGWVLKARLRRAGVTMVSGVRYEAIDDAGLHYTAAGEPHVLACDTVVVCAGQEPERGLYDALRRLGIEARLIGGAEVAEELDAMRAIEQATRLALEI